jgi:hypothetical protein
MIATNTVNDGIDWSTVKSIGKVKVGAGIVQENDVRATIFHKLSV